MGHAIAAGRQNRALFEVSTFARRRRLEREGAKPITIETVGFAWTRRADHLPFTTPQPQVNRGATMTNLRVTGLTALAMTAFAGNSLLCRVALTTTGIDASSFTTVRVVAGAATLWLIVRMRGGSPGTSGSWRAAFALFAYAACFSWAYAGLTAATGALVLFAAVQATMVGGGLLHGERLDARQTAGFALALCGLVGLLLPGLAAPPWGPCVLMIAAGIAWGVYSILGKGRGDPLGVTAGNFIRAMPCAVGLNAIMVSKLSIDASGAGLAIASGALTSGIGYAIWYAALARLKTTHAAMVQLSVPVIAAAGAVALLGEALTMRLVACALAILGGIALAVFGRRA